MYYIVQSPQWLLHKSTVLFILWIEKLSSALNVILDGLPGSPPRIHIVWASCSKESCQQVMGSASESITFPLPFYKATKEDTPSARKSSPVRFFGLKKRLRSRLVQTFPKTKKTGPGPKKTENAVFFSLWHQGAIVNQFLQKNNSPWFQTQSLEELTIDLLPVCVCLDFRSVMVPDGDRRSAGWWRLRCWHMKLITDVVINISGLCQFEQI